MVAVGFPEKIPLTSQKGKLDLNIADFVEHAEEMEGEAVESAIAKLDPVIDEKAALLKKVLEEPATPDKEEDARVKHSFLTSIVNAGPQARTEYLKNYLRDLVSPGADVGIVPEVISGLISFNGEKIPVWANPNYAAQFYGGFLGEREVLSIDHLQQRRMLRDFDLSEVKLSGTDITGYKMAQILVDIFDRKSKEYDLAPKVETRGKAKLKKRKLSPIERVDLFLEQWGVEEASRLIDELNPEIKAGWLTSRKKIESEQRKRAEKKAELVEQLRYVKNKIIKVINAQVDSAEPLSSKVIEDILFLNYNTTRVFLGIVPGVIHANATRGIYADTAVAIIPVFVQKQKGVDEIIGYIPMEKDDYIMLLKDPEKDWRHIMLKNRSEKTKTGDGSGGTGG